MGKNMDIGHMKLENAKKIIDESCQHINRIGLSGLGETLLYPHLIDLVDYIVSKNPQITISMSTNAGLPSSPRLIDSISRKVELDLQISIDGCGEIFEKIRKGEIYNQFLDNLKKIKKITSQRKTTITLNMVLLKENCHQISDVIYLAKSLGIKKLHLNTVNLVSNDWALTYYDFYRSNNFLQKINEAKSLAKKELIDLGFSPHNLDMGVRNSFQNCPLPWDGFYISWNGYLVQCCAKPFPKIEHFGNVFESSLFTCINNAEFVKIRKMWNMDKTPEFCRRCHLVQ